MPGVPEEADWNVRSIKEHLESLLNEADRRYKERYEASQTALLAALLDRKSVV